MVVEHTEPFFAYGDVFNLHKVFCSNKNLIISVKRPNSELLGTGGQIMKNNPPHWTSSNPHSCGLVGWIVNDRNRNTTDVICLNFLLDHSKS